MSHPSWLYRSRPKLPSDLSLSSLSVKHFPLVRAATERLGILEVLSSPLPMDPQSEVSDADCITAMVMTLGATSRDPPRARADDSRCSRRGVHSSAGGERPASELPARARREGEADLGARAEPCRTCRVDRHRSGGARDVALSDIDSRGRRDRVEWGRHSRHRGRRARPPAAATAER